MAAIENGAQEETALPPRLRVMCEPGARLVAHAIFGRDTCATSQEERYTSMTVIYGSLSETVDAGLKLPARLVAREESKAPSRTSP